MQDQISNRPMHSVSTAPAVKLWTPGFIAGVSFLLGFPAGIVLASINWMRMKRNDKAMIHIVGGGILAVIFIVLLLFTPSTVGRVLGLVFNLGVLFYLQQQMKKDTEAFQFHNKVEKAGELDGCLIGVGILVAFLAVIVVLVFGLTMLGVPLPE